MTRALLICLLCISLWRCDTNANAAAATVDTTFLTTLARRHLQEELREEDKANQPCQPHDLTEACPDSHINALALETMCDGTHSTSAAGCYMKYLCLNHNQNVVNEQKECLDTQCPLAKRMPTLDCSKYDQEHSNNEEDNKDPPQGSVDATTNNATAPADPTCTTGLLGTHGICCFAGCTECGGAGCAQSDPEAQGYEMGAQECCVGPIFQSERSCSEYPPPCNVAKELQTIGGTTTESTPEEEEPLPTEEREENKANAPCQISDLTEACPDDSVQADDLQSECQDLHGLQAAKCYMEYLCQYHNQLAVNNHKACIDGQCPLAKRAPTLDCAKWNSGDSSSPKEFVGTEEPQDQLTEGIEIRLIIGMILVVGALLIVLVGLCRYVREGNSAQGDYTQPEIYMTDISKSDHDDDHGLL